MHVDKIRQREGLGTCSDIQMWEGCTDLAHLIPVFDFLCEYAMFVAKTVAIG